MGYDIHITRKDAWYADDGPEISMDEWTGFIASDPEMRLDGYAEAKLGSGKVLGVKDPSMAVWIGHPDHGKRDGMAWMWLSNGNVMAKNPDDATLRKMWRMAALLGARVQGDDEEIYGPDGEPLAIAGGSPEPAPLKKPWWRIWR